VETGITAKNAKYTKKREATRSFVVFGWFSPLVYRQNGFGGG
jgi:hypothetical protein